MKERKMLKNLRNFIEEQDGFATLPLLVIVFSLSVILLGLCVYVENVSLFVAGR